MRRGLRGALAFAVVIGSAAPCLAASPTAGEGPTVLVLVDDASKATLGPMPLSRTVYARAIDAARKMGAKGVALKFFFESASTDAAADDALARAIASMPVLLQVFPGGRMQAPEKLARPDWAMKDIADPLRLTGVAPPFARFAQRAYRLGFVEARPEGASKTVEVAGLLGNQPIESMQLEIAELATGERARIEGNQLTIGRSTFPLDAQGRVGCDVVGTRFQHVGIDRFLAGEAAAEVRGKVVVLGYNRSDAPTLSIDGEKVPVHIAFYRQAACLARLISADRKPRTGATEGLQSRP